MEGVKVLLRSISRDDMFDVESRAFTTVVDSVEGPPRKWLSVVIFDVRSEGRKIGIGRLRFLFPDVAPVLEEGAILNLFEGPKIVATAEVIR